MFIRLTCCVMMFLSVISTSQAEPSKKSAKSLELPPAIQHELPAPAYVTLMLVRDQSVHEELNLNGEQLTKVKAAIAEVDEPLWVLRDTPLDKCGEQVDSLLKQLRQQVQAGITAEQWTRLEQIILQARGFKALRSPEIRDALNITDGQLARIQKILDGKAPTPKMKPDKEQTTQKTAKKTTKAVDPEKVYSILSDDQRTRLLEMFGKPFNLNQVTEIGCVAPDFREVDAWINGDAVTRESFRGKVTVIHFWTFGCINCVHNLPHYESWREKFSPAQVAIIGFHTPETDAERNTDNVKKYVQEKGIKWTVAVDTDSANWKAWGNHTWPSVYLIDKQGRVRYWWYGEMNWQGAKGEEFMRKKIEGLLKEK